jgi:DNA-binding transcriptional ArsR family regulator
MQVPAWYAGVMDYEAIYSRNRVTWLYEAARSPKLSASAVRVGLVFATFMNPSTGRERVRPKYEWLMKAAHMSRATLAKSLKELEDAGFIEVVRYRRSGNYYTMPFDGTALWRPGTLSSEIELP